MRKRWAIVAVAAAMIGVAVAGSAMGKEPRTLQQAQAEDLDFFETRYVARDMAMSPEEKARALGLLADLKKRAGSLTPGQFFLGLADVVATADNGHSLISFGSAEAAPQTKLPLVLTAFDDSGMTVVRALPEEADLAGALLVAIEGKPVGEVLDRFRRYYGGGPGRRTILAAGLMASGGMLQAAGFAPAADKVHMTFRKADGSTVDRDIPYVPTSSAPNAAWWPSRWWSPEPIAGDATPWRPGIDAAGLPLYLQDADKFERLVSLPDLDAVYVEFKTNEGDRGAGKFAGEAEKQLGQLKPKNLIVDLRFDKGGDLRLNAKLMQSLTSLTAPGGQVFVIVGRYTFSAGMVAAAIAKKAGGSRLKIVGEPVGDYLRFWSEGDVVCAPNSKICTKWTDGYFDLIDGCKGEKGCFRENFAFDFVVGSLDPDIPAPMTAAAWLAKRDPAMDAIKAYLGK